MFVTHSAPFAQQKAIFDFLCAGICFSFKTKITLHRRYVTNTSTSVRYRFIVLATPAVAVRQIVFR